MGDTRCLRVFKFCKVDGMTTMLTMMFLNVIDFEYVLVNHTLFNMADEIPPNLWHYDVINWEHFLRYWLFVGGIYRSPVNSPHKDHSRGALMFSLICTWAYGKANNGDTGDLRRHRAYYDVTVMGNYTTGGSFATCLRKSPLKKLLTILICHKKHKTRYTYTHIHSILASQQLVDTHLEGKFMMY